MKSVNPLLYGRTIVRNKLYGIQSFLSDYCSNSLDSQESYHIICNLIVHYKLNSQARVSILNHINQVCSPYSC